MRKKLLVASMLASSLIATDALAEVGFEFRVPFQITKATGVSNETGYATLLSFDVGSGMAAGILNEHTTYTDTGPTGALAAARGSFDVTALRVEKKLTDFVSAGVDVGNVLQTVGAAPATGMVLDVFGRAKFLSSRGKVGSFMSAELMYRSANTNMAAAAGVANLGGVKLVLSAGIDF